jgi:hypothetical protein
MYGPTTDTLTPFYMTQNIDISSMSKTSFNFIFLYTTGNTCIYIIIFDWSIAMNDHYLSNSSTDDDDDEFTNFIFNDEDAVITEYF